MKNFQQNTGSPHGHNSHATVGRQNSHPVSQAQHGYSGAAVVGSTPMNSPDHHNNIPTHYPRDEELGHLFFQMRELTGADLPTLASHLQTTPQILSVFERGEVELFPPWAETVRIVSSLTLLVNVDSDPILNRISEKTRQPGPRRYADGQAGSATNLAPQPTTQDRSQATTQMRSTTTQVRTAQPAPCASTGSTVASGHAGAGYAEPSVRSSGATRQPDVQSGHTYESGEGELVAQNTAMSSGITTKKIGMVTIPLIIVFAFFLAVNIGQKNGFTGPLGNYAKAGWELFNFSSSSNGLRWINVKDPRSRKADKLPVNNNGY